MGEGQKKTWGLYIPAHLMGLVERGDIGHREAMLAGLIHTLDRDPVRGCWASDEYLAERMAVSMRTTRRDLMTLEENGLITRRGGGTGRVLRTTWEDASNEEEVVDVIAGEGCAKRPTVASRTGQLWPTEYRESKSSASHCSVPAFDGETTNDSQEENTMPLLPNTPPPKSKITATEEDIAYATRLLTAVRKKHPGTRASVPSWSKEFGVLRRAVGTARLEAALAWYEQKIGGQYVPMALAAGSFRAKFASIEAAMRREGVPQGTQVGETARDITTKLLMRAWPGTTRQEIEAAVQTSLDRYTAFRVKWESTAPHYTNPSHARTAMHILRQLPPPRTFVLHWFQRAQERLSSWTGWDGKPGRLIFDVMSEDFQRLGRQWCREYNGNPETWTVLFQGGDE